MFELFKIGLVIGDKIPNPEVFTPNFVEWRIFPRVECGLKGPDKGNILNEEKPKG